MRNKLLIERKTINAMVNIYCNNQHTNSTHLISKEQSKGLCPDCNTFLTYAYERLKHCPNRENKTNCKGCTIHCYSMDMRNYAREVMRYSGKYMLYKYPLLTLRYLLNKIK